MIFAWKVLRSSFYMTLGTIKLVMMTRRENLRFLRTFSFKPKPSLGFWMSIYLLAVEKEAIKVWRGEEQRYNLDLRRKHPSCPLAEMENEIWSRKPKKNVSQSATSHWGDYYIKISEKCQIFAHLKILEFQ